MPKLSKAQWDACATLDRVFRRAMQYVEELGCSCSKQDRAREGGEHVSGCEGSEMADDLYEDAKEARLFLESEQPESTDAA